MKKAKSYIDVKFYKVNTVIINITNCHFTSVYVKNLLIQFENLHHLQLTDPRCITAVKTLFTTKSYSLLILTLTTSFLLEKETYNLGLN